MARTYPVVPHTVFGGGASAAVNGIAQFGSKQAGSPNYSVNIATIQALSAWLQGWAGAVTTGKVPPLEELNAALLEPSYQIASLFECGIPDWNSGITYSQNSMAQLNGLVYKSLTDANLNNSPSSSPSNWQLSSSTVKGENLFHNAGLIVAQRGNSGTITAGSPAYTVDGWIVGFTGANGTWDINFGAQSNNLTLVGGTGVTDTFIKQRIESLDVSQMVEIGEKFTFQCQILNNTSSPIIPTLAINSPNAAADNYGATATILAATNLQSVPANSTAIVSFTFSIPNNSKIFYGLELILDFGTTLNGALGLAVSNFDFSNTPNLSAGLQSNPPLAQIRPIGIELPNCQRYFQNYGPSGNTATPVIGVGYMSSSSQAHFQLSYPAMRSNPAITFPVSGFFIQGFDGTAYSLSGGTITGFPGPAFALLLVTGASGFSSGTGGLLSWQNSSSGSYSLSSEL